MKPSELIDERIRELGDWRGETLARVRELIQQAEPEVVEEWKWRGIPVWYRDGMICTGETYKDKVKVTFAKGASLDDPAGLFNSSLEGNVRRAIDLHEGAERLLARRPMPRLHERFPELAETLPHLVLSGRPTPLRELPGLGVWVKEDGAFGAGGWGGNKVRKLEWLIPDAKRRRRRTILTFGGLGTNWGLATALYGREHGLETALALVDQPIDEHVEAQLGRLEASGARIHRTHTKARTVALLPWLIARNARGGRPPYLLPAGGSSAVGVLGYVEAALEIAAQVEDGSLPEPAHAVVAVGTGGTAAGLALGFQLAGLRTRVVGVVVNDQLRLDGPVLARHARRAATLLERRGARLGRLRLEPDMLHLTRDQIGAGYGHGTEAARRAAGLAAEDGLRLDPVYTAKAMAGLLALRDQGRLGDRVLFVHTDGPR